MVFASIREHASTAIFLRAWAEIKKFALRAHGKQFREYNSEAASTSYIETRSSCQYSLFWKNPKASKPFLSKNMA